MAEQPGQAVNVDLYFVPDENVVQEKLPTAVVLPDIRSSNVFTLPAKQRIGRVKFSPKQSWIMAQV